MMMSGCANSLAVDGTSFPEDNECDGSKHEMGKKLMVLRWT